MFFMFGTVVSVLASLLLIWILLMFGAAIFGAIIGFFGWLFAIFTRGQD